MKTKAVKCAVTILSTVSIAMILAVGPNSFGQSSADQSRQAQITKLKANIAELQKQLREAESEKHRGTLANNLGAEKSSADCCARSNSASTSTMAQTGGSEHPMGEEMGGGMGGGGTMGGTGANPQASPGMPMEEHMKGMEHMHGMMHGGQASPSASPGAMPMEHGMGGGMGGNMQGEGGPGGAQPQATPSSGMGGMGDM